MEKMGKWMKAACKALASWEFDFTLRVAEQLIDGLDHFYHAVLKLPERDQTHLSLARLVCGGAQRVLESMSKLLEPSAWNDVIARVAMEVRLGIAEVLGWESLAPASFS